MLLYFGGKGREYGYNAVHFMLVAHYVYFAYNESSYKDKITIIMAVIMIVLFLLIQILLISIIVIMIIVMLTKLKMII